MQSGSVIELGIVYLRSCTLRIKGKCDEWKEDLDIIKIFLTKTKEIYNVKKFPPQEKVK